MFLEAQETFREKTTTDAAKVKNNKAEILNKEKNLDGPEENANKVTNEQITCNFTSLASSFSKMWEIWC